MSAAYRKDPKTGRFIGSVAGVPKPARKRPFGYTPAVAPPSTLGSRTAVYDRFRSIVEERGPVAAPTAAAFIEAACKPGATMVHRRCETAPHLAGTAARIVDYSPTGYTIEYSDGGRSTQRWPSGHAYTAGIDGFATVDGDEMAVFRSADDANRWLGEHLAEQATWRTGSETPRLRAAIRDRRAAAQRDEQHLRNTARQTEGQPVTVHLPGTPGIPGCHMYEAAGKIRYRQPLTATPGATRTSEMPTADQVIVTDERGTLLHAGSSRLPDALRLVQQATGWSRDEAAAYVALRF